MYDGLVMHGCRPQWSSGEIFLKPLFIICVRVLLSASYSALVDSDCLAFLG
jgi:hypothetical protein